MKSGLGERGSIDFCEYKKKKKKQIVIECKDKFNINHNELLIVIYCVLVIHFKIVWVVKQFCVRIK